MLLLVSSQLNHILMGFVVLSFKRSDSKLEFIFVSGDFSLSAGISRWSYFLQLVCVVHQLFVSFVSASNHVLANSELVSICPKAFLQSVYSVQMGLVDRIQFCVCLRHSGGIWLVVLAFFKTILHLNAERIIELAEVIIGGCDGSEDGVDFVNVSA